MVHTAIKWKTCDFSQAMSTAIAQQASQRLLRKEGNTVKFNGFWRDGDKQNICLWLDKATWHDAKTGEGGGCKEFAKTAFNLSLPEFMTRYGQVSIEQLPQKSFKKTITLPLTKPVHQIWTQLQEKDLHRPDKAAEWLIEQRGFEKPRVHIGSGFSNFDLHDIHLFETQHHSLMTHRVSLGPQLIVPIRGVHSDQVQNFFIRAIGNVAKEEKSRLLTGAGGWKEPDGSPRAFGFPHLIHDFPNLVLCEGMADYFAAECLLRENEKYLPIGASNAAALMMWAEYLARIKYAGQVIVVYQLDSSHDGSVSVKEIRPSKAIEAMRIFKDSGIKANLFNWLLYIENTTTQPSKINDLADSLSLESINRECGHNHLNTCFLFCL